MTTTSEGKLIGASVVVVGGSSGMGTAVGAQALAAGARVHLVARSADRLEQVARGLGDDVSWAAANMANPGDMAAAVASLDRVDHVVITAIAGELDRRADIGDLTSEQVERSFDRLRGYVSAVQACLPVFQQGGSMTFWCGASAVRPPRRGFSLLAAENASVAGFVRALALELAPTRVNAIMAGVVDTAIHAHHREDLSAWAAKSLPAAHLGQPGVVAEAAMFLMTNRYTTGQVLTVDGGFSLI